MNAQERLFAAIGSADPHLIARSEGRRRRRWPRYCLAAAACLALLLALGRFVPERRIPSDSSGVHGRIPAQQDPLRKDGVSGSPYLRLLSYEPQSQEEAVNFLIYVNEEQFSICEENGLYSIRSTNPLPEGFPDCGLDIFRLPGRAPAEAKASAAEALADRYDELFLNEEGTADLPDSLYLRASGGTDWDSEQAELWFAGDGKGGTFVLTARYFTEAEEGMGGWFQDMVSSFRVVSLDETVPGWMRDLCEAAERLYPAIFSNDLSEAASLVEPGAGAEGYGEDVWAYITIISVDYAPDDDQDPSRATVSVKHRLNLEEGDSVSYLTMELRREDGRWLLTWAGLEK